MPFLYTCIYIFYWGLTHVGNPPFLRSSTPLVRLCEHLGQLPNLDLGSEQYRHERIGRNRFPEFGLMSITSFDTAGTPHFGSDAPLRRHNPKMTMKK